VCDFYIALSHSLLAELLDPPFPIRTSTLVSLSERALQQRRAMTAPLRYASAGACTARTARRRSPTSRRFGFVLADVSAVLYCAMAQPLCSLTVSTVGQRLLLAMFTIAAKPLGCLTIRSPSYYEALPGT
jgi:hypothetical protein